MKSCGQIWKVCITLYYNTLYNVKTLEYLSVLTLQRHFSSFPSTATLAVRLSQFWSSGSNGTSWCLACRLCTPLAQPGSHDQTTSAIRPQRCCLRLTPLPPTLVAGLDPLVHESWYCACSPNTPPFYVCLILPTIGTTAGRTSAVPGAVSFRWAKPPTGQNWGNYFVRSVQLPNLLGRPVMRADGMIAGQALGSVF